MVLDASAALDYLVEQGVAGGWAREVIATEAELAAPHLLDLELTSGLRRRVQRRELSTARVQEAFEDFQDLALTRYPATSFLPRIWALRSSLTPYDAAYVVLSEALGVPLATTDLQLARSHGHRAEIITPPA
jgi:predicted nucleic acid-binding protein